MFKAVKENSGFGWDDVQKIPTAPDEVWDEYIEVFPAQNHLLSAVLMCTDIVLSSFF